MFQEHITCALKSVRTGEYRIVGNMRNALKKYVIFFVSSCDGVTFPMEYLEEAIQNNGVEFDVLMQVCLYWENDKEYRIDFEFRDWSNIYLM